MRWVKHGVVLRADRQFPWMQTHAALPIVEPGSSPRNLYFTSRDSKGRSHIGRCVLRLDGVARATDIEPDPVLSPGPLGAFDDAGVTGSCLVKSNGRWFLFYTGWSLGVSVPFYLQAGLATSDDGVSFTRASAAPLLDRSEADPFLTASPWVLVEEGRWRMWYVSGTAWEIHDGKARHRYLIKYAESDDGYAWRRRGLICVPYRDAAEYAFGRPCVVYEAGRYRMWYSSRGEAYRLGYAESADGLSWERQDDRAGMPSSASGWDSEMITYPVVFRQGEQLLMLYNGNGYGGTGIGLAVSA